MKVFWDNVTKRVRIIGLFFSGLFNLSYVSLNVFTGLFYHNLWYFSITFLHSIILFVRFYLLRVMADKEKKIDYSRIIKRIGYSLILIDTISLALCFYSILLETSVEFNSRFIYPLAVYLVYSILVSLYGIFLSVKNKSATYLAYRNLTLTTSLYTAFNLVYSIYLSTFGGGRVGVLLVTFIGAVSFCASVVLAVLLINKEGTSPEKETKAK